MRRLLLALLFVVVPAHAEPGDGFEVVSYRLALTPDLAARTVVGTETLVVRVTDDDVRTLVFSPNALTIDHAAIDDVPVAARSSKDGLEFVLPDAIARGRELRLTIAYHGRPARGFAGTGDVLYTSYFACDWMVCLQDRPGDKADFALDLRVPEGLASLSVGRREDGDGDVHRWRSDRPVSAYLFGFAIGPFVRVDTRVDGVELAWLGDDAIELTRRFAETGAMVRFLTGKAGLPLPGGHYAQLLVDGDEAQEAASYAVLGRDVLSDPADDWAIVHELAHQWWGNSVTCATWRDFWLNEGFATFMTAAWKEHRHGRAAYDAELDRARDRLARARERGYDRPLAWLGTYPSLGLRRAVQYSKGALFLDHLRTLLGEDAFWSGVADYTRTHAGGTVTSVDLQRAMERASGRDLADPFRAWVYGKD